MYNQNLHSAFLDAKFLDVDIAYSDRSVQMCGLI